MRTVGDWGSFDCERLEAEDLNDVSVEAIGEDLKDLFRHRNAVDAQIQRRLVRFEKGEGYAGDGCVSAKAWLRWQCHLTYSAASQRVEVARQMQSLELTSQAMAEGDISYEHASMIARTSERLGEKFEGPAEAILVELARKEDPVILRRAIVRLRHCVEPDGVLEDANQEFERRFLHLSQTFGGMFVLNGQFGADDGATLQTALDALMTPPTAGDERSASERRADAMTEMARRQLDGGQLPQVGGQKPHLMVTVDGDADARAGLARGGAGMVSADPGRDRAAHRLRLRPHTHCRWRASWHRPRGAGIHEEGARRARQALPVPGLRHPGLVDGCASHQALGGRGSNQTLEPDPALPPPSSIGA